MGYDPAKEPSAKELHTTALRSLTDDYVYRQTRPGVRAIGEVPTYAGIGVDIPPAEPNASANTRKSACADTIAALRAGARDTLISRDSTEMQLAGIEGVGKAVADWKAGKVNA
ncbi:MAG: hypothetical protein ACOCVK_02995 [bacterium]